MTNCSTSATVEGATAEAATDDPQDRAAEEAALDPTIECAQRHRRMLQRLLEIAMTLAEGAEQEALAQKAGAADGDSAPAVDPSLKLSRVSRCIRLTMALEMKTCEALRARQAGFAVECEERRKAKADQVRLAEDARLLRREQTVHEVMDEIIRAEHPDREDREAVEEECYALLNDDEDYEDMLYRPIGETIARLCKDLDLTPDWSQWADEDWAIEEAQTQADGSPYAEGLAAEGSANGEPPAVGPDPQHPPPHPSS